MIGARAASVAAVLVFLLAPLGCRWWEGQPPASPPVAALQARLEAKRSVSFRSFDGKAWATDSDTEMTLFQDQRGGGAATPALSRGGRRGILCARPRGGRFAERRTILAFAILDGEDEKQVLRKIDR
jgi:hypothetical protein